MTTTKPSPSASGRRPTSSKRRHEESPVHDPPGAPLPALTPTQGSTNDENDGADENEPQERDGHQNTKSSGKEKMMMKKKNLPLLGATEFAAVLNSSGTTDYNALYRTLKNFVVTVRRERRIALGGGDGCRHDRRLDEKASRRHDDDEEAANEEEESDDEEDVLLDEGTEDGPQEGSKEKPSSKRYKKDESWKQDTANYNVPFVGTSFSAVQDTGTIVPGEWPTGLLLAYLKKSPLAVELVGDANVFIPSSLDGYSPMQKTLYRKQKASAATTSKRQREKQEKLVQSIHKYYLQALVELVSAAIPISLSPRGEEDETENDDNDDKDDDYMESPSQTTTTTIATPRHDRFLPELVQRRLPGLLHLLKLETGAGKGVAGVVGGCGPLVAPVIQVLAALVQTSASSSSSFVTAAHRQVARALELGTIINDAIVRFLLVPRRPSQLYHHKSSSTSTPTAAESELSSSGSIPRNQARAAMLELAAALAARDDDHTLVTSIITPGVKDRKIPPGILYVALKEGLLLSSSGTPSGEKESSSGGDDDSRQHWHSVTKLLQVVRHLYLLVSTTSTSRSGSAISSSSHNDKKKAAARRRGVIASPRALADLWTRDAIQSLCVLSTQYAPVLSSSKLFDSSAFFNVLEETDTYHHDLSSHRLLPHQRAGVEARRLLFTLLANPQCSPLLYDYNNAFVRTHCEQLVVRAMVLLLDGASTNNNVVAMQNFLLHVVQTSPTTLPNFFREMQFPHMTAGDANTQVFPTIARWNFVTKILLHGPSVVACIGTTTTTTAASSNNKHGHRPLELNYLYPVNIKKQHLRKALLSANAFLVAETLKLVIAALRRFHIMTLESHQQCDEAEFTTLATAFCNVLPDVQCLRTILQRFGIGQIHFNPVVIGRLCETFRLLAKALPQVLHEAKVDWVKLLLVHSKNVAVFTTKTRISFQCKVLDSLHEILMASEVAANLTTSLQPILQTMINTTDQGVMERARQIALFLLHPLRQSTDRNTEATSCLAYEAECWVDGMTMESVDEFIKVVQESASIPLRGMVDLARAWRSAGISTEPIPVSATAISTILLAALLRLQQRPSSSPTFELLALQVATKCLLYHEDPRPLAAVIIYRDADSPGVLLEGQSPSDADTDEHLDKLSAYAKSLIHFESLSSIKRKLLLDSVMESLFGSSWKKNMEKENDVASIRNLSHWIVVSASNRDDECPLHLFRCKIAAIIKDRQLRLEISSFMYRVYPRLRTCCSADDLYPLDVLLMSCGMDDLAVLPKNELDTTRLFSSLRKSDPIYGAHVDTRASLLFHMLLGPFLPRSALNGCVTRLLSAPWKQLTTSWSTLCAAFLKLVDGRSNKGLQVTDVSFSHVLWQTWLELSIDSEPQVLVQIQSIIADAMSSKLASVLVMNTSLELSPPRAIIHRAARIQATASWDHMTGHCLVSSLIQNDYIRFGSSFVKLLVDSDDVDPLKEQLKGGELDKALLATLDRVYQSDDADDQNFLASLAGLVLGRASTIFEDTDASSQDMEDASTMLLKLDFQTLKRCCQERSKKLTKALQRSFSGATAVASMNRNTVMFRLALHFHHSGVEDSFLTARFASVAFARLSELTLHALQQVRKKSKRTALSPNPIEMSQLLCAFLNSVRAYDDDTDSEQMTSTVLNLVRVCLKLGMKRGSSDEASLQTSCLQLVRALVAASKASCPLQLQSNSGTQSLANLVFDLCTAHSSFSSILIDDENRASPLRLETILLLLCCISGNNAVKFEHSTWETLLSAYGGGMDTVDKAMRRLLFLYAPRTDTSPTVFMHQIRWNTSSSKSSQSPWDWLATSLEMSRVYATLRRFPLEDVADPTKMCGIEEWGHADERKGSLLSTEYEAQDQRYSTGFVLPLILGAVEFVYEGLAKTDDDEQDGRGTVVVLAQRLCDSGALALALAGLCSTCHTMRKVSLSILYLMTQVVQSEEARQLAPWRQRPQLGMVLDAVQRALAIRKAEISMDSSNDDKIHPPQLPPTVAIFLAKASLVLHRPGHHMYPAINRFFLRIDADHGAFQDLNRLPGFISLFCSSSDEAGQAQKEQMWAVEVLRDSFLDETCYKGLMTCHAPELLLTTLDSLSCRAPSLRINESELLLGALLRIVSCGGHRATSHLIGRLGLLSWLQSFMAGRGAHVIIPSPKGRILFLRLVKETVQRATGFLSTDDIRAACSGMAQAVLTVFLDSVGPDLIRDSSVDSLAVQACAVLGVIRESCGGWKQLTSDYPVRPDGSTVESASRFLSILDGLEQRSDAMISICSLPVCMEALSSETVISFSTTVLGMLKDVEAPDEALLTAVFKRVHFVLSTFPTETLNNTDLQAGMLSQHSNCCRYNVVRELSQKCSSLIDPSFARPP